MLSQIFEGLFEIGRTVGVKAEESYRLFFGEQLRDNGTVVEEDGAGVVSVVVSGHNVILSHFSVNHSLKDFISNLVLSSIYIKIVK